MEKSETINKLAVSLCKAQEQMGGANKNATNPFFKSQYSDLTEVIQTIKSCLHKNGLSIIQAPVSSEKSIGVETILLHESGEYISSSFTLPMIKMDPQQAGSAITYARRYALKSWMLIPDVDDDAQSCMQNKNVKQNNYSNTQSDSKILPISDSIKNRIKLANDLNGLTTIYHQLKDNNSIDQAELNSLLSNRKKVLNENK